MGTDWPLPVGVQLPTSPRWPITLRAGALVLRPMRRSDEAHWQEVRRNNMGWLQPWEATAPPHGRPAPRNYRAMLRAMNAEARAQRMLPWGIAWDERWPTAPTDPSRVPVIGQLTLSGLAWGSARSGQIGYWIDRRFAGRGITPAAVALVCDFAFAVLHLHRIEICIRPENAKSLRVAEKLQLRSEGVRPDYLFIDHAWTDHQVFAVHEHEAADGMLVRVLGGRGLPGSPAGSPPADTPPADTPP